MHRYANIIDWANKIGFYCSCHWNICVLCHMDKLLNYCVWSLNSDLYDFLYNFATLLQMLMLRFMLKNFTGNYYLEYIQDSIWFHFNCIKTLLKNLYVKRMNKKDKIKDNYLEKLGEIEFGNKYVIYKHPIVNPRTPSSSLFLYYNM